MNLDADDESYVPLLRKIKATEIVRSGPMSQLMIWLLTDAAFFDRTETVPIQYGTASVKLSMGESFINVKQVAEYLRIPERTFRRCLDRLVERETITVERIHGGLKIKLVNAERHWQRWAQERLVPAVDVAEQMAEMRTHPATSEDRALGDPDLGPCHKGAVNLPCTCQTSSQKPQEIQGLGSLLELKNVVLQSHEGTTNNRSTTPEGKESSVVGVRGAAQLDLIAPDPVPLHSQDKEIEVSRFFAAKEEQKWKDLEKNGEWLHAMVTAHPDTAFILRELANYYQWWIENPKKRRENLAASIGNWLRNEARRQRGSNGNNRAKSLPVPTEPGKYDGIGVTYSAFEE